MKRKAAIFLIVAAAASWSSHGRADTLGMFGASSRGTAMGGAMISISEGWEAVHYNPSALALSRDSASVQISMLSGSLMKNDENQVGGGMPGLKFGINHRFLRDRIGVGLIVGTSPMSGGAGDLMDIGSLFSGGGAPNWQWAMYQDSSPLIFGAGAGIRLTNWLAVGVNVSQRDSMISTSYYPFIVDPVLEMLIGISTGVVPSNVNGVAFAAGGDPEDELETAFDVTFRPIKYLSFGYMYKPEQWTRIKLRLELVGGKGSVLPESQYMLFDMKIPGQVETTVYGGAGHIPIPWNDGWLTVSYAHETQNWDGFYPSTVQYSWDASEVFSHEFFNDPQPRDPGLEDVDIDRYGLEYEGSARPLMFWRLKNLLNPRFTVRGGYYHWTSPQPDAQYTWQVAMIDADADVYSFGLGFGYDRKKGKRAAMNPDFPPRVEFDLHVQMTNVEDRDYVMQPNEWGSVPLQDYDVETEGGVTNIGFQVSWLH